MTTTTGSTTETTAIGGEEILSTAQLRAEAETAEGVLEDFSVLARQIGEWTRDLPDRYVAAPFGTSALTTAINAVTEAEGDGAAISEALAQIVAGLDEADSLGEKVTEYAADGQVEGFTPN